MGVHSLHVPEPVPTGSTRAACAMRTPAPVDLTTPNTAADENDVEDDELARAANNEPMPLSLGSKNHPRFCVEKHLKKYQVIYPFGPKRTQWAPLSAKDAHIWFTPGTNLHTPFKDRWRREFRQVREAEKPHKIVASRKQKPRRNPSKGFGGLPSFPTLSSATQYQMSSKSPPSAQRSAQRRQRKGTRSSCGLWQTDPYNVPSVKNGKSHGASTATSTLWTPQHVPPGTVHINLPGHVM